MQHFLKVQGHDGLVRDVTTKAIVNTNKSEYEEYMARRKEAESKQLEEQKQKEEINNIKSDISEIKQMLAILLKDR